MSSGLGAATDLRGLELTVEKLVPGGEGFLRLPDGQALFVRGGAPGDRIRLGVVEKQRGTLHTHDYELLSPSPERVVPECPVAHACGGCDLMHVSRQAELVQKASMLRETLERVAGVAITPAAFGSDAASAGYRSRVRFHIGRHGKLGFFARGSHQLVEVPGCAIAPRGHGASSRGRGPVLPLGEALSSPWPLAAWALALALARRRGRAR